MKYIKSKWNWSIKVRVTHSCLGTNKTEMCGRRRWSYFFFKGDTSDISHLYISYFFILSSYIPSIDNNATANDSQMGWLNDCSLVKMTLLVFTFSAASQPGTQLVWREPAATHKGLAGPVLVGLACMISHKTNEIIWTLFSLHFRVYSLWNAKSDRQTFKQTLQKHAQINFVYFHFTV